MRILNWNTQADKLTPGNAKFRKVRARIAQFDADIVCLTEAYPGLTPDDGQTIQSELSGWQKPERRGARKVVMWSRYGWSDVETLGSPCMPPGRFIKATTVADDEQWTIVGMCIPYHAYRAQESWGDQRKTKWQGAREYLDALRQDVLPALRKRERVILIGDFNLQIPPYRYPSKSSAVNQKRKETFDGWNIATAGELNDPALDRRFIDHVALSADIKPETTRYFSRFDADGTELSDHNGVFMDIRNR